MHLVADFHLHSKYSRAVSQHMTLSVMADVAREKGIDLLTVSDFTQPLWFKEIQTLLEEAGEGVYQLKSEIRNSKSLPAGRQGEANPKIQNSNDQNQPKFILSTEISCIYSQGGKLRRIHNLIFAPNIETVEKINAEMKKHGYNLHSDGRPIIGLPSRDLFEMILTIDERCMLIPCHVWTPHFGLYGSASGFDSIEEAFGDLSDKIYGIETGLSSDPEMNWQIPELENRSILSFSDAHSPAKMGREATVFDLEKVSYDTIRQAIMAPMLRNQSKGTNKSKATRENKSSSSSDSFGSFVPRILYTVEFYPEEGKYHYSGHRNCKVVRTPEEIREEGIACSVCGKRLTEGVFIRLQHLSGKETLDSPLKKENEEGLVWFVDPKKNQPPYVKLVPLLEIVAESLGSTVQSQKSKNLYSLLLKTFGTEFDVLLKTPVDTIATTLNDKVAQGIAKVRSGNIVIHPGFDGEYGVVKIWGEGKDASGTDESSQLSLGL